MENKDSIRNTKPEELLKTKQEQLDKNAAANDKELDFHNITLSDTLDTISSDTLDETNLTDARELDGTLLAENDTSDSKEDKQ